MVHYPENEAVIATVVMADHLEAVNMRLDLDGYDASQTIGHLRVFPQMDYYNLPNTPCTECGSRHNEEKCPQKALCTLCGSRTHLIDECFAPYPKSRAISDNRAAAGLIGPANRCGHCLQRGCSIPCQWSHQWATSQGIVVQYRWTDKPEEAVDSRAEEHDASRADRVRNGPQSYAGAVRTTSLPQVGEGPCVGGEQAKAATENHVQKNPPVQGVVVSSPDSDKTGDKSKRVANNKASLSEVSNGVSQSPPRVNAPRLSCEVNSSA